MGRDVEEGAFSREDRIRYRQKVRRCLDVFALMLDDFGFDADRPMTGLEIELNLIDAAAEPAMRNEEILADIADPLFQTELGQFNLELNAAPRLIEGGGFADYEHDLREQPRPGRRAGRPSPTPGSSWSASCPPSPSGTWWWTTSPPTSATGCSTTRSSAPGARTSSWTSAASSGCGRTPTRSPPRPPAPASSSTSRSPRTASPTTGTPPRPSPASRSRVGANSPFLYGRQLWAETRIALFEQATDTRPDELKAQGVRPRVWFGERWITSIFDLFEENVRYFPPLLPICEDEDPVEVLHAGGVPQLAELRLHNGTVYRWNRPVYDIMNGRPHLRVENRVLPAGPTVVDMLANAAFYFGLARGLAEADRPIWSQLTFSSAEENFHAAARRGLDAVLHWPGLGDVPVTKLVLEQLLPTRGHRPGRGSASPRRSGTGCSASSSGAAAPAATARSGRPRRSGRPSGATAWTGTPRCTTWSSRYAELQRTNEPVHTWEVR